jgi:hypothetical protein
MAADLASVTRFIPGEVVEYLRHHHAWASCSVISRYARPGSVIGSPDGSAMTWVTYLMS